MLWASTDVASLVLMMQIGLGVVVLALVAIFLCLCRVLDELREINERWDLHELRNIDERWEGEHGADRDGPG
jgi:hypothetical protein